jgi:hypothetical protein
MKYVGAGKLMKEKFYTNLYIHFSTCMDCSELKRSYLMFLGQLHWDHANGACVAPIYILACFKWKRNPIDNWWMTIKLCCASLCVPS